MVRGPYSSRDDDQYEQLKEFVKMMIANTPDLIIMVRMNTLINCSVAHLFQKVV